MSEAKAAPPQDRRRKGRDKRGVSDKALVKLGQAVIDIESQAVADLRRRIDDDFVQACRHMLGCRGRIVVLGMGKSGHIGGKIAATLASTGSPAFFVHPGEASHGDLGMITANDVVIAISNSGETHEIVTILPLIRRLNVPLVAMTGNRDSTLSREANVTIDISVREEACPLGLAPTSSTTATLAMGDALAIALLEARGFTEEDFARSHPGGSLGRRLLLLIDDIMHTGEEMPRVPQGSSLADAVMEMTRARLGFTAVVDAKGCLAGVFTDGDLRRLLGQPLDVHAVVIDQVMNTDCATVQPGMLAAEALQKMEERRVNAFPVVDADGVMVGAMNMHDLLRAGVV